MVRFFLLLVALASVAMIGGGLLVWLPTSTATDPIDRLVGLPGLIVALAGFFLLTICAGLDELIRLVGKIERHARAGEGNAGPGLLSE